MALNPTTPGVYVEEVSTLPSSVVPVPTAIPVFIGYTDHVEVDGNLITSFPTNPIRVESFMEFQNIFGGAISETYDVTLSGPDVDLSVKSTTSNPSSNIFNDFRLFYNMQMYFANGGGPCYVISVGDYSSPIPVGDPSDLSDAIELAEQVDEITLVVVPDAMSGAFDNDDRRVIYDAMLAHCAKMQDRFSLFDVLDNSSNTIVQDADAFRNDAVGANHLNYGAAYYPSFNSAINFSYQQTDVTIKATDNRLPASAIAFNNKKLSDVKNGIKATDSITIVTFPVPASSDLDISIPGETLQTISVDGLVSPPPTDQHDVAVLLAAAINANTVLSAYIVAIPPSSPSSAVVQIVATAASTTANSIAITPPTPDVTVSSPMLVNGLTPDVGLYSRISAELTALPLVLYPSATMAGIYAAVDNDRGVWKAPANVSVSLVDSLNRNIKDADQGGLNVDPTSGKSIDAIRAFPGRGMLVWGARTLDGNSNDFRYINVRRTLIFIEDSCKHASEFVVFEPNDKNTWIRVKGMIGNFLTNLWRDGALVGAKPEQAFFVQVGLGETMTAQDILEGRMIVLIGVAISHPAEFILLRFEHKLQES